MHPGGSQGPGVRLQVRKHFRRLQVPELVESGLGLEAVRRDAVEILQVGQELPGRRVPRPAEFEHPLGQERQQVVDHVGPVRGEFDGHEVEDRLLLPVVNRVCVESLPFRRQPRSAGRWGGKGNAADREVGQLVTLDVKRWVRSPIEERE